jgi:hypothetical protein
VLLRQHLIYFAVVVVTRVHIVFRLCVFVFYLPIFAGFQIGICAMIQHINKLIFSSITVIRFYVKKTEFSIKLLGTIEMKMRYRNAKVLIP